VQELVSGREESIAKRAAPLNVKLQAIINLLDKILRQALDGSTDRHQILKSRWKPFDAGGVSSSATLPFSQQQE
jgi:hypothetical protein